MSDLNIKGHLSMASANIMWGLMSPAAKIAMSSTTIAPLIMVDMRVAGAAILFWISSLFFKHEHVPPKDLLLLAGAAMIGIVLNQGCFIVGISYTSPGEGSLITTTMPMWVMILAWIILHEPITAKKAGGIALGAIGAIILVVGSTSANATAKNPTLGDLIVLAAQLSYALYLTLYRNFIKRYSLITLMKWMFLFATMAMVGITLPSLLDTQWGNISQTEWAAAGYVVIFGTYFAYICVMTWQKILRPTIVGMYNYVQPVTAACMGIYLGMEQITISKCIANMLIFSGVYMVTTSKSAQTTKNGMADK